MNYTQKNIAFNFKNYDPNKDDFIAAVSKNGIQVEFCINAKYFENEVIDWEFVQKFSLHFMDNFDFINKKSIKIAEFLYNEFGNKINTINRFKEDDCKFTNVLLVELLEPFPGLSYPKAELYYLVDNVVNSNFTYLNTDCIFVNYNDKAYFEGVRASRFQD